MLLSNWGERGVCGMWISVLEDEAVLNNLITKYLQKEDVQQDSGQSESLRQ